MKKLLLSLIMVVGLCAPALSDVITLKAISAWPKTFEFTRQFQKFIDRVNREGKGVVQIQYVGGPELTPAKEQDVALRNGVFDIQMGAASYYNGVVPEGDALIGATIRPPQVRESGALAVLDKIWRKKLNAHFVAWQSGGVGFYVFLSSKPKFTNDKIDLRGLRLRSVSLYKDWFEAMGATNVMMPLSDVYSAFQRGLIQGLGSPALAFSDIGVNKFVHYRVGPKVWQIDVLIIMNAKKWDSLPKKAQDIITQAAKEHELETERTYKEAADADMAKLKASGCQFIDLTGKRREIYVKTAHDIIWNRLKKRAPENAAMLRKLLYK